MTTEKTPIEIAEEALQEAFNFVDCDKGHPKNEIASYARSVCAQITEALAALRAHKEVDVEGLKKFPGAIYQKYLVGDAEYLDSAKAEGWNDCIDHLASQGYLQTPANSDGWQPIETAPKDGTHILAHYVHNNGLGYSIVVYWDGEFWSTITRGLYGSDRVGHWQPLPAAPGQTPPPAQGDRQPNDETLAAMQEAEDIIARQRALELFEELYAHDPDKEKCETYRVIKAALGGKDE